MAGIDDKIREEKVDRLVQNFIRLGHVMKMRSRSSELRSSEMGIIRCIMHHRDEQTGELKPSQISSIMGLQQPTITPQLRSLEDNGYVRRRNGERDRREVYISLTEKTYQHIEQERARTMEIFRGLSEYLGDEDSTRLMEIMDRVSDYLDELRRGDCGECRGGRVDVDSDEGGKES